MTHRTRDTISFVIYLGVPALLCCLAMVAAMRRGPPTAATREAPLLDDECSAQIIELPAPPASLAALNAGLGSSGAAEVWSRKALFLARSNQLVPLWVCEHKQQMPAACADLCRNARGLGAAP